MEIRMQKIEEEKVRLMREKIRNKRIKKKAIQIATGDQQSQQDSFSLSDEENELLEPMTLREKFIDGLRLLVEIKKVEG